MTELLGTTWPISASVVERLGWVLVHSLWQFALVALLAGAFVRALHRRSAAARYGLLVVAMAVSLIAPVATWLLQPDDSPARPAEVSLPPDSFWTLQPTGQGTRPRTPALRACRATRKPRSLHPPSRRRMLRLKRHVHGCRPPRRTFIAHRLGRNGPRRH